MTTHKDQILGSYQENQQTFLAFVLEQYVKEGVAELDQEKLPQLLDLKYHSLSDAIGMLGSIAKIREVFIGFQRHLYAQKQAESQ